MIHGLVVGVDHGVDVNLQQTGFLQTVDQFDGFNVETGVGDASQSHGPAAVLGFQQGMDAFFAAHRRNQGLGQISGIVEQNACALTVFQDDFAAFLLEAFIDASLGQYFFRNQHGMAVHAGEQHLAIWELLGQALVVGEFGGFPEILVPAPAQQPFGGVEAVVPMKPLDGLVKRQATF